LIVAPRQQQRKTDLPSTQLSDNINPLRPGILILIVALIQFVARYKYALRTSAGPLSS
jgi:hypothetical protein